MKTNSVIGSQKALTLHSRSSLAHKTPRFCAARHADRWSEPDFDAVVTPAPGRCTPETHAFRTNITRSLHFALARARLAGQGGYSVEQCSASRPPSHVASGRTQAQRRLEHSLTSMQMKAQAAVRTHSAPSRRSARHGWGCCAKRPSQASPHGT